METAVQNMKIIYPNAEQGIVHRAQNSIFSYAGWPSVTRDENGVLYAAASAFRVGHICPFGKTAMYVSRNGGKTWTPPIVVNDTYLDDRDAGILYMGNGRMLVTWFSHSVHAYQHSLIKSMKNWSSTMDIAPIMGMLGSYPYIPEEQAQGGSFLRISEDYGVTWSDPIRIDGSAPHGPNICRDGSLIYLGRDMYATNEAGESTENLSAYRSTDGGYHWEKIATLTLPEGTSGKNFHEPHVAELPDGRLLGAIRAQSADGRGEDTIQDGAWKKGNTLVPGYTIYTTVSSDGGRTWSDLKATGISGAPPHLLVHSTGALICSYIRREPPFSIRAMVSYDMGESWSEDYILTECSVDGGYPGTVEMDDGSLVTVYYGKYGKDPKASILSTRWTLAEK